MYTNLSFLLFTFVKLYLFTFVSYLITMNTDIIKTLYKLNKDTTLQHRYITNSHIEPILNTFKNKLTIKTIGRSVLNRPIYGYTIGTGTKKILMWSQMHGNESTTTKALIDLTHTLLDNSPDILHILESCTLYIIPILNPDGAQAYTRVNANAVDLNRDAQNLTQPESIVLRKVFNSFKPDYCYNLHGQRTIFSAGKTNAVATVSFLSPAQDHACTVTQNRKIAMEIIGVMNTALQQVIPNQVGVYDDAFNLNCVGDTFQNENVPTILFEAGHYKNDYARETTRELIYLSYLVSLDYISKNMVSGNNYEAYFKIPENEKLFFDVIIKQAKTNQGIKDIGILYKEVLVDGKIEFLPKVEKISDLSSFFAHKLIEANSLQVLTHDLKPVTEGYENVFVIINSKKIVLISK